MSEPIRIDMRAWRRALENDGIEYVFPSGVVVSRSSLQEKGDARIVPDPMKYMEANTPKDWSAVLGYEALELCYQVGIPIFQISDCYEALETTGEKYALWSRLSAEERAHMVNEYMCDGFNPTRTNPVPSVGLMETGRRGDQAIISIPPSADLNLRSVIWSLNLHKNNNGYFWTFTALSGEQSRIELHPDRMDWAMLVLPPDSEEQAIAIDVNAVPCEFIADLVVVANVHREGQKE